MNGCDDLEYEVTLVIPHVYRVKAASEQQAKQIAERYFAYSVEADVTGFPEAIRVKEIEHAGS